MGHRGSRGGLDGKRRASLYLSTSGVDHEQLASLPHPPTVVLNLPRRLLVAGVRLLNVLSILLGIFLALSLR